MISICNLKYSVYKRISTVFHNGSNYDDHFIIKEIAEVLEKQFTCLEENIENYRQKGYQTWYPLFSRGYHVCKDLWISITGNDALTVICLNAVTPMQLYGMTVFQKR